ncbi:MAG: uncharacterized protein JWQ45_805 [Blastococcus sp.]|nr:uncharacterized protein [Blastococcus sp.]
MRWQQLFADLQGQFDAQEAAAERAEWGSRARSEIGAVALVDRLRGAIGTVVSLQCRGVGPVTGRLNDVGVDWLLLEDDHARTSLVALAAVRAVSGLSRRTAAAEEPGHVRGRLDLRRALRALARDRAAVQVVLDDGSVLTGTVDRVGADYLELAEHPVDQPRRAEAVQGVRAVVIASIALVRSGPGALG